jgi:hypothetical protein
MKPKTEIFNGAPPFATGLLFIGAEKVRTTAPYPE